EHRVDPGLAQRLERELRFVAIAEAGRDDEVVGHEGGHSSRDGLAATPRGYYRSAPTDATSRRHFRNGDLPMLRLKRVYEPPEEDDGYRILVDRLWPRGLSRDRAAVDEWLKEIAPSSELRRWFRHDPAKWPEFQQRYRQELRAHGDALERIADRAARGPVTLL